MSGKLQTIAAYLDVALIDLIDALAVAQTSRNDGIVNELESVIAHVRSIRHDVEDVGRGWIRTQEAQP